MPSGGVLLAQQVAGDVAQYREVFGGVPRPDATLVLVEGDVEDTLQLLLDPHGRPRRPEPWR